MCELQAAHEPSHPRDDLRSVGELISFILSGPDENPYWDAVCALHWRGNQEVLERATLLGNSVCAVERRAGADILGQLGVPDRNFPEQSLRTLLGMLEGEESHEVLRAILVGLSHLRRPEAIVPASRFRYHADPDVRHGVVFALMGHEQEPALVALIELTRDPGAHVRDWATFALGSQVETDTPKLREALLERISDEDDDTREEALVGLARRGDRRVVPAIQKELTLESVGTLAVEAAAKIGDPTFYIPLIALQDWWDLDLDLLVKAIRACSPGPGWAASHT